MASLLDLGALELNGTSSAPPPSIPTLQTTRSLGSAATATTVLAQSFSDRVLVLVTQLGRIGSLIQISPPPATLPSSIARSTQSSLFPSLPPPHPSILLTPLFGVAPNEHMRTLYELYATMVGAIVFSGAEDGQAKPVVLGIALRLSDGDGDGEEEEERRVFGEVMDMVKECKVSSLS